MRFSAYQSAEDTRKGNEREECEQRQRVDKVLTQLACVGVRSAHDGRAGLIIDLEVPALIVPEKYDCANDQVQSRAGRQARWPWNRPSVFQIKTHAKAPETSPMTLLLMSSQ